MIRGTLFPPFIAVLAMGIFSIARPASSEVNLRFSPYSQQVLVGESGSLSVVLDSAVEVRTIELWVRYDDDIVLSLNGVPGWLYTDSACPYFPLFEEEEPGTWYGAAVALGPGCFVTGPGELYRWDFEGLADGYCSIAVDSVALYGPMAELIDDVSLSGATITVGTEVSVSTPDRTRLSLGLAPNPFHSSTTIHFGGRPDEQVTVSVFDISGRHVATLWRGRIGSGLHTVQWDGRNRSGFRESSGVYFFLIRGEENRKITKSGVLTM